MFNCYALCYIRFGCPQFTSIYQQKESQPIRVAEEALERVLEFNKWNLEENVKENDPLRVDSNPRNIHIVQVDAGVFTERFVTFGCLIKNHDKEIILATYRKKLVSVELVLAKIMAIRWSLLLAQELKLQSILVQLNAIVTVDCILNFEICCHYRPHVFS